MKGGCFRFRLPSVDREPGQQAAEAMAEPEQLFAGAVPAAGERL
jgi:hypothetical protein